MLHRLVTRMDRRRVLSRVVSLTDEGTLGRPLREAGVPVDTLGCRRGMPSIAAIRQLRRILSEDPPDVLQGWMYHGNLAAQAGHTLSRLPSPVFWNIRHTPGDLRQESVRTSAALRLSRVLSFLPAAIIYNSVRSAERHEQLGFSARRRTILYNGFDLEQFAPRPAARAELRRELGLPDTSLIVGHIAHFSPMKDHATLFAAVEKVARDFPHARFVLAGIGVVESNVVLRRLVETHGLIDRVRLLGERHDIPRWLPGLDVAVSSSAFGEGFMNAIGEAMACGVPCVATDVGDTAYVVGDTGSIVPPRDPVALAAALAALLSVDLQARERAGMRARARVAEHFSLAAIAAQYESLYGAGAQGTQRVAS